MSAAVLARTATRPRPAPGVVLAAAVLLLAVLGLASLALGARSVGWSTLLDAWLHADAADGDHAVVRARLPRTAVGVLVGLALGLAGAVMQGVTRNPLADPGILGVNAGAALAVVVAIAGFGVGSVSGYVWFAFAGAAAAAVLVYAVASLARAGATPLTLALAGAATSAGLVSLTNGLLVVSQDTFDRYRFWALGSVAVRSWDAVLDVLPFLVVGTLVALATARALNGLALGEDSARSLGQRPGVARAVAALSVVLLCGAATAVAGPIGFVGLVVPHAARSLVGGDHRWVLPVSAVLGAALLVGADTVGRVLLPPTEVQAGLMTALVGAPVFVWLVRRRTAVGL
ncbi:FecCD family ABC transporter permease [Nocardioides panacis]|uniref:FecCD family ABC transporter permease n=1 Tax=Nocardioides panacis TaxID=2849501 RepID=UPI0020B44F9E|nr:iron ABC transporter permease [Nocardioides panacis]